MGRTYTKNERGTLVLALGIGGLICCGFFAPVAWALGHADLKDIRDGIMDPKGEQFSNIGRILGMIGTVLLAIQLAAGTVYAFIVMLRILE